MSFFSLFRKVEPDDVTIPILGTLRADRGLGRGKFLWITDGNASTPKGEIWVTFFGDKSGPDAIGINQWNDIYTGIEELKAEAFPKIAAEAEFYEDPVALENLAWNHAAMLGEKRGKSRVEIGFGSPNVLYRVWVEDGVPTFVSTET